MLSRARAHAARALTPRARARAGNYVLASRAGDLVFLSGHLPQPADGPLVTGTLGGPHGLTPDEGYAAARLCGLSLLATLRAELGGDLDRVARVHKLVGFVACAEGFAAQPAVINGCSDLMGDVFGERGRHARSAVGTNALPLGVPVEIEAIFEVRD